MLKSFIAIALVNLISVCSFLILSFVTKKLVVELIQSKYLSLIVIFRLPWGKERLSRVNLPVFGGNVIHNNN